MTQERSGYTIRAAALGLLVGAVVLTMALILPPAPRQADAPTCTSGDECQWAAEFSAGRAMQDVFAIAGEPHPMGVSREHAEVRDYFLSEIRALGLEPQVQSTVGMRLLQPGWLLAGAVENILVRVPGRDPDGAILMMSHYDTTPGSPGGVDSSSGVAAVLELLRAIQAGPRLRQDTIFFFTDGEEPGTLGAHAFVAQHPWLDDVRLAINMDSYQFGPPMLVRTTTGNGLWVEGLARSSKRPAYMSLPFHLFPTGDTDLLPFGAAGVAGADIVMINAVTEAHTMADRPELVDPGSLQQAGDHALALVRHLGDRQLPEREIPDQTFFPVLGKLIHYPAGWAAPLAALVGLVFLGTLFYGFRKRALRRKGMGVGFAVLLAGLGVSVGIANGLWLGIQTLHPEYAYSPYRPHMSDDYLYTLGFLLLTLAVFGSLIPLARRRIGPLDLAAGTLVFWCVATIAATVVVPASSYFATWTLAAGSLALTLALAVRSRKHGETISGLGFLTAGILATFLWVPNLFIAYLSLSAFLMLSLMMGLAACWLGAMVPFVDWVTRPKRWALPAAATLVGLGFLVAGHFLVGRNSPPPPVNSIGYWLDPESGEAQWVAFIGGGRVDAKSNTRFEAAFPTEMDERQVKLMADPVRRPYRDLYPGAPPFSVLTSAAPALPLAGPGLEVLEDDWVADRRAVKIRVTASMHDRVYVLFPDGAPLLALTLPGNEPTELPPVEDEWVVRFDGTPVEGIEIELESRTAGPFQVVLVEERTGLPSFPGLELEPAPGTMPSPGEYDQGIPADFSAMYGTFVVPGAAR